MKKLYCVICSKYRKSEKPKISYFLEKTLIPSITCSKRKDEDEKIFKEKESIGILEILGLIKQIRKYKFMREENINQKFRLKKKQMK